MKTEIILLLDKSGSMSGLRDSIIDNLNDFVKEQRNVEGECSMTLVQFDDRYDVSYVNTDIHSVPMLSRENYSPLGTTALIAAMGRLIDETGKRLRETPEANRPRKILFMVQTDGYENASDSVEWGRRYTREKVAEMIRHQTEKYSWTFVYLGANQDAFLVGDSYGYAKGNSANWSATPQGTEVLYCSLNNATRNLRQSNAVNTSNFFAE